ncbi:MAG: ABC transporter ATP-binding protein, partial [Treponema sp.]|nr:ABC transporter ATP-binding protein [Treponema sp.]
MADFFDSDVITKEYDPRIMRRILGYVRPYRRLAVYAVAALFLATAGELALPVLIKHTVDDALMPSWYGLRVDILERPEAVHLGLSGREPEALGRVWVKADRVSRLSAVQRDALAETGILDREPLYLAKLRPGDADANRVLAVLGSGAERDGSWAAIRPESLRSLAPADARILRDRDRRVVLAYLAAFFLILALVLLTTYAQIWASALIGQNVIKDLRMELFRHTSGQSLAFLSRHPVGRLVTRLTGDVETLNEFFTSVVISFAKDASLMIGVLAALVILSPRLGFVVLATLPPVLAATTVSRIKARDAFRRQRQWLSKVNSFLSEHLSGVSVVKLFAGRGRSSREFSRFDAELLKANLGEMYVFATFRPVVEFLASCSLAVLLWYGAGLHTSGAVSLGTLIAFINLVRMFYNPVQDISEKYTILQSAMAGGERVFKRLDSREVIEDAGRITPQKPVRGRIEFERVWFAYKNEEWVLKDLSFTVEPGEMVAIVGYTGAGKTTIANLLARMWDAQKGRILVDGIPIRDIPLQELRRTVQPVPQDVFLFSGSVAENIRLGSPFTDEEVEKAAKIVHAHGFISRLEGGYEADLSEGASNISTGQRQLISFARVVAHNPAIVILDEATSSVDTETEKLVQKGLAELLKGRTSVVIAHRLST